jgi:hypothetical protein
MRKLIYFRIAGRDVHTPKLVGAFVVVWALLMFIHSTAVMFDSWDNLKAYKECAQNIDYSTYDGKAEFAVCAKNLYDSTGVVVRPSSRELTIRQFWQGLLVPIANVFFWLAVLFVGWMFYKSDRVIIPIEENIRDLKESKQVVEVARPFAKRKK